jgi:MFS family permease
LNGFAFVLRALRSRNYRLFFAGQLVSLIGTWMTATATSWLVYRLSGSAYLLGVVGFAGQFPAFLVAPLSGILVDRWDKRRILIATQTLSMAQSFALAFLTLTHRIGVGSVLLLQALQGIVNAFDVPCRQSFVVEMLDRKEDLGNAIALNSSMMNAARLIGPSIAGVLIAASGEGPCFLIDGVSYAGVIAGLLAMRIAPRPPRRDAEAGAWDQLGEGLRYTFGSVPIRSILLLLALVSMVGVPYSVLLPVFAQKILGGGSHTMGFLMASAGCGAFVAALWLASRRTVLGLGGLIPFAAGGFGLSLVGFAASRSMALSVVLLALAGFSFMLQMAASNTIVQTIVDDDKRGRVMGFYIMAFLGSVPLGSLLAGALADRIGAPTTLALGGGACLAGAIWFSRRLPRIREHVRPIYRRMGILAPQVPPPSHD